MKNIIKKSLFIVMGCLMASAMWAVDCIVSNTTAAAETFADGTVLYSIDSNGRAKGDSETKFASDKDIITNGTKTKGVALSDSRFVVKFPVAVSSVVIYGYNSSSGRTLNEVKTSLTMEKGSYTDITSYTTKNSSSSAPNYAYTFTASWSTPIAANTYIWFNFSNSCNFYKISYSTDGGSGEQGGESGEQGGESGSETPTPGEEDLLIKGIPMIGASGVAAGSVDTNIKKYKEGTSFKLDKNTYFGVKLKEGYTLQENDTFIIHITTAADLGTFMLYADNGGSSQLYDEQKVYSTTSPSKKGEVKILLPASVNGKNAIYLWREDGSTQWNPTFDYIAVKRKDLTAKSDATLKSLSVEGGTLVPEFAADKTEYDVELAYGTTEVPKITAVKNHEKASEPVITPPQGLPGDATVKVTAEDETVTKTYTIHLKVAGPSTIATLSNITYGDDNKQVEGFSSDKDSYSVVLPKGTTSVPKVTATATDGDKANVSQETTGTLPGTVSVKITVTAQDGTTQKTYTVTFMADDGKPIVTGVTWPNMEGEPTIQYDYPLSGDVFITGQVKNGSSKMIKPEFSGTNILSCTPNSAVDFSNSSPDGIEFLITGEGHVIYCYVVITEADSHDASLKSLTYGSDNTSVPNFSPTTYEYTIVLPVGIKTPPDLKAETTHEKAKVKITAATGVPGTAYVDVTAQDGTTTQRYTVNYENEVPKSTDATLKSLSVTGYTIAFDKATYTYNVELAYGTQAAPAVNYEANDTKATVKKTDATSPSGETKIEVTAEDGTTILTYTIKFSVKESVVPKTDLTKHVPGIYEEKTAAGGYGGTLNISGGREYEVYYASFDNESKLSIALSPAQKSAGITTPQSETSFTANDGWFKGVAVGGKSNYTFTNTEEFKAGDGAMHKMKNGNEYEFHIEGFDQFSIIGKDNNADASKGRHLEVYIDDILQEMTVANTVTIRRFTMKSSEHVIRVKAIHDGDSNNELYAFSLRVTDEPHTRYIKGNDTTQVILQTQAPKPVTYFTKYNSKGETKLEWEGQEATGITLEKKGSTAVGDTLVLSGTANCPVGEYKYHVVTYMGGKETSRASGKFSVATDIRALGETIVDAYQNEEMEVIEIQYYALDASGITLTWANGKTPAGIVTSEDKSAHKYIISGTTTAAPGSYYYTVTIAGSETVINGYIEVISQDLGVDPVLYLYQTKSPRRGHENDGVYAYLRSKGINLQARTTINKLRPAEQYAKYKWILISEDVNADNQEVLEIIKGSEKGGVGLPVLNLKGFTYTADRLDWGEPDNGSRDTLKNNGCNIYIERADHPIFKDFNLTHGAKLQIFDKIQQNGVMPIRINLPGTLCLATAYTRSLEDYYQDGELQTAIHEIPAAMRGGKKYICVPLSMSSSKSLTADGKALFSAIVKYLTDDTEYKVTRPTLQINSFSVNNMPATITNDLIYMVYDSIQHPDMDIKALAPEIVLEDGMTHVVPASGEAMDFTYSLYKPVAYVVTDFINRRVYDVVIQAYAGQGLEEATYTVGDWVTVYDIYGRIVTMTNENIYTMELPHGMYIAVTEEGKSLKVMR